VPADLDQLAGGALGQVALQRIQQAARCCARCVHAAQAQLAQRSNGLDAACQQRVGQRRQQRTRRFASLQGLRDIVHSGLRCSRTWWVLRNTASAAS
jgi:hypothetical protein